MASSRPTQPSPGPPAQTGPGAIDLLEEAVHRLRLSPLRVLNFYYLGTLPFILGLLYFWADLGSNPDAPRRAAGAALGMTLLFWWMKSFQAVFVSELRARFNRRPAAPWTLARVGKLVFVQGVLHSTGLFVLPIAAFLTIPLGWVYAAYQNVTALGDGETGSTKSIAGRAISASLPWPKQNHVALTIIFFLGVFICLNIVAAVYVVPQLLRQFTGEENVFTRSGTHLFNSTFFAVSFSLVYLAVDPLIKAFYALRCFYSDSLRSGEDLKSELRALPSIEPEAAAPAKSAPSLAAPTLALFWAVCAISHATAAPAALPTPTSSKVVAPRIAPEALRRSAENVLRRPEFAWRAPREQPQATEKESAVLRFFANIRAWLKQVWRNFQDWLRNILPKSQGREIYPVSGSPAALLYLVYGFITLIVAAIVYLLWQTWRGRRRARRELAGEEQPANGLTPDLTQEQVLATQLPEDEWLQLARRLRESGEPRLAMRALYLSILASLGERGLVSVARHKSNRDYLEELRRRARDAFGEAPGAFARNMRRFERVWYGPHPASEELLEQFMSDRQTIVSALASAAAAPAAEILPTAAS